MATLGSKLVTKEMQWNANMTEQNHLGAALLAKPQKLLGTMDRLFSAQNYYSDNPLTTMLLGNKLTEETIGTTSWEWDLKGASTRPLIILENVEPESNTAPGKFGRPFKIKLDENWYLPGDYIHPGTSNKKYQLRIQTDPQPSGDGWIYTVVMASGDPKDFLPLQYLKYGQQWGKLFSKYEEAAEQSGSTQFSMPITLANRMSLYRKEYKVTNYAATEVLAVAIPVFKEGSTTPTMVSSWIKYAEIEYWQQWYRELERGYWYSRSTDTVIGANGRPVRSGPGVQEQLEDSHIHRYSTLSARLIEEYLMDIFYSCVKPGKGRAVKAYTGEYGMLQFHRAVMDWMNKSGFIKNVEVFTNKVQSPYHTNALEGGYQFVKYNMANGSSLELIHNPLYDDRQINFEIDPVTGFPMESQRFTFLDFNSEGNKPNLKIMNKKDGFAFGYVQGLYGPYGPVNGGTAAHSGSYYEMHVEKSTGLHIGDVTRCGELILSRN
jgi:hypothetical protein